MLLPKLLETLKRKVHRLFITEDALKKLNRDNQSENLVKKVHVFYKTKKKLIIYVAKRIFHTKI